MMDPKTNMLKEKHGQLEKMLVKHGFQLSELELSECDYLHVNVFGVGLPTTNYSFIVIASWYMFI